MKTNNTNNIEATELKNVNNSNNKDNGSPSLWKSVLVGGIPGIIIGLGGSMAYEAVANSSKAVKEPLTESAETEPAETEQEEIQEEKATIKEAHSVNDDMTFDKAFAAARAEVGPDGYFIWNGKVYGTHRGDDPEWLAMTEEERAEHSRQILAQVHHRPFVVKEDEVEADETEMNNEATTNDEPTLDEFKEVEDNDEISAAAEQEEVEDEIAFTEPEETEDNSDAESAYEPEQSVEDNEEPEEDIESELEEETVEEEGTDVQITGVGVTATEDGSVVTLGIGEVSGSYAEFRDMDSDGEIDTVLIDSNDDGRIDADEIIDTTGEGLTVTDMVEATVHQNMELDTQDDFAEVDVELI